MTSDLLEYYSKRAVEYERVYAKPERQNDLRRAQRIFDSRFKGRNVLEVSCGTGYWTERLAFTSDSIVACDASDEVLDIARGKNLNRGRVEFRKADSYALPNFGRKFSAGFAGFWLSHIPKSKLRSFFSGFNSHLISGAIVSIVDNRYVEGSSTPIFRTDSDGNSFQVRHLADGTVHEVMKNFPLKEELERTVAEFAKSVEVVPLEYYWILNYELK